MNKLDKDYQELLQDILDNGQRKGDRTGTGTISVFGRQIRHNMKDGFPLLTTKKMYFKGIVTELLWFLRGETNIKSLVDNDCHIWDGDAYKNYEKEFEKGNAPGRTLLVQRVDGEKTTRKLSMEDFVLLIKTDDEFAKKWGELGPVYGKQWRSWTKYLECGYEPHYEHQIDQIKNLIHDLKTNPDSRRLMVTAWNPSDLEASVLPPCHYGFQVYTRELSWDERHELAENKYQLDDIDEELDKHNIPTRAISLSWNQRSVDTPLGLPFNIASYALLLEIIGKMVNMVPDELIGNLGDTHIYSNQVDGCLEQIGREFTKEEIQEHLSQSGMDALKHEARMEYVSKLPKRTREPYPLSKLVFGKTDEFFRELENDLSLLTHLDSSDFKMENYQSHPTIKFPLSN